MKSKTIVKLMAMIVLGMVLFTTCHSKSSSSASAEREMPTAVVLKYPGVAEGFTRTPIITVEGVAAGATVTVFTDRACTVAVGSAVVAADQTKVDITVQDLGSDDHLYDFYAQAADAGGEHPSACSSAHATYHVLRCPEELLVGVDADDDIGTGPFCVMATEAKQGANDIPVAQYAELPWADVNALEAKAACKTMSYEGMTCDLISNHQWMAIARDIERTASNWSEGEVGRGTLNRGHSDSDPSIMLSISNPANPWDQTLDDSETWLQKRTFTLSNGGVIWDLAGNGLEWVDWETGGDTFSRGPISCEGETLVNFYNFHCAALEARDYLPGNPAGIPEDEYTGLTSGIGSISGVRPMDFEYGVDGTATRGGSFSNWYWAGIFALSLNGSSTTYAWSLTFRCTCWFND